MAIALVTIAVFIGSNANAQMAMDSQTSSPVRFGVGLETGLPTGQGRDFSHFELGGTARLQFDVNPDFAFTLTSGYYNFFGRQDGPYVKYNSLGVIPVKAGIKWFYSRCFYFGMEAGEAFELNSDGTNKLDLAPAIGIAGKKIDVSVRYENFSNNQNTYGMAALRIAYGFGI